jgi:hypothetical protein
MSQIICYENENGGVSVVIPADEFLSRRKYPDSPDNFETHTIQDIIDKDVPKGVNYVVMDKSDIPNDRTFRQAWVLSDDKKIVDIDIDKATDIKLNQLRAIRAPLLASLDVDYMRALEAGDLKAQKIIADKKQALRDCTNEPLPKNVEDLKNYIPDVLIS